MATLGAARVYLYVPEGHKYCIRCNYARVREIVLLMSDVRPSGAALLCMWNFPIRLPTSKLEDKVFISKVFLWRTAGESLFH